MVGWNQVLARLLHHQRFKTTSYMPAQLVARYLPEHAALWAGLSLISTCALEVEYETRQRTGIHTIEAEQRRATYVRCPDDRPRPPSNDKCKLQRVKGEAGQASGRFQGFTSRLLSPVWL